MVNPLPAQRGTTRHIAARRQIPVLHLLFRSGAGRRTGLYVAKAHRARGHPVTMTATPDEGVRNLTTSELARQMRVSVRYVRLRCRADEWPHLVQPWKGNHRYLFTPEHVELIEQSMQPSTVIEMRRPRKAATTRKGRK